VTLVAFELVGFSNSSCRNLPPTRVAFLLASWYRLVRRAVNDYDGIIDRCVADRVTTLFGFPRARENQVRQALSAAIALHQALVEFNRVHALQLSLRAAIVHGPVLAGRIIGDFAQTSIQGPLLGDMKALSKTKAVNAAIRLTPAAYHRVSSLGQFIRFDVPPIGEAWALHLDETLLARSAHSGY